MNKSISGIPQKQKELDEKLKEAESDLSIAKAHHQVYDTHMRLTQTEIPKLEAEISSLNTKLASAAATATKHADNLDTLKSELRALENLKRPVGEITRFTKEIEEVRREIARIEAGLVDAGGKGLSGEEIRAKMEGLDEERGRFAREVRGVTAEKERARVKIQGLKEGISGVKVRIGEGESRISARRGLMRDIEDVQGQIEKARDDMKVPILFSSDDLSQSFFPTLLCVSSSRPCHYVV